MTQKKRCTVCKKYKSYKSFWRFYEVFLPRCSGCEKTYQKEHGHEIKRYYFDPLVEENGEAICIVESKSRSQVAKEARAIFKKKMRFFKKRADANNAELEPVSAS